MLFYLSNKGSERYKAILIELFKQFLKISFVNVLCRDFKVLDEKFDDLKSFINILTQKAIHQSHMQNISSFIISFWNINSKLLIPSPIDQICNIIIQSIWNKSCKRCQPTHLMNSIDLSCQIVSTQQRLLNRILHIRRPYQIQHKIQKIFRIMQD